MLYGNQQTKLFITSANSRSSKDSRSISKTRFARDSA